VRSLFIFQRLNDRAMSVPSPAESAAKHAKCLNTRRYTVDHRSGMVDRNVDVSTTDDEFSAPLSTNDDRSKQMKWEWGVGSKEWEEYSSFSHSPLPIPHSPFPSLRIVKLARQR
jgi:hypothetical protein